MVKTVMTIVIWVVAILIVMWCLGGWIEKIVARAHNCDCTHFDYEKVLEDNNATLTAGIVSALTDLIEQTKEEEPEKIWIDTIDYTALTKSQIQARIASLDALYENINNWPSMSKISAQVAEELERANTHLINNTYMYPYTDEDFLLLSYMIYVEAGAPMISDEEQCLVASVIINRRNQNGIDKNLDNPTIKDIINEPQQYAICKYNKKTKQNTFYVDVDTVDMSKVTDRCRENARKVLEGEFECPGNVVFQSLFVQGEIYKSFYHSAPFYNTTYICYGE